MIVSIILFFLIISILVIIHELGHMFVAKYFGVKVHEFGLGYPPKAKKIFSWKGTDFTLNWIPFGGFVRLEGEGDEKEKSSHKDSLSTKKWYAQILILLAGVSMNFVFAWILLSISFMVGAPSSTSGISGKYAKNIRTVITSVSTESPAEMAGLKVGDRVLGASVLQMQGTNQHIIGIPNENLNPTSLTTLIKDPKTEIVQILLQRGRECDLSNKICNDETLKSIQVAPQAGIIEGSKAIGISLDTVGTLRLPFFKALGVGMQVTLIQTKDIFVGFGRLVSSAFTGSGAMKEVSGPVGIVGIVHDVQKAGWVYVLSLTALISLNLAVLNLVPFPALDGGRILVILIETAIRRPLPEKFTYYLNLSGFSILMLFMLVVTYQDILRLIK
jgi:regulator of sigma E protease